MSAEDCEPHVTDAPDPAARGAILGPLLALNQQRAGPAELRPLAILLHGHGGQIMGGLWGCTAWGWLFVKLLFVPESRRDQGIGRRMLLAAERGCRGAWLDTFSFQAPGFYRRPKYDVFGTLDDDPPGQARYFKRKRLRP